MSKRSHRHVPVLAVGALGLVAGLAGAQQTVEVPIPVSALTAEQLQARVIDLEARLNYLETNRPVGVVQAPASADAKAEMMAAAAAQTPTAPSVFSNGKFKLSSDDGNYTWQPYIQYQLRFVGNLADVDDYEFDSGFEVRRLRFGFQGNVFNKSLTYKFQWATSQNTGNVLLEDAQVAYRLNKEWSVFGGQFKDPLGHEELMSPMNQLAVDRSLVNALLSGGLSDYVQGVGASWTRGPWETWVAVHDGQNSDNTNFQNGATDWGMAGRAEYLLRGDKKNYNDFTARGTKQDLFVIGGGADISGRADDNRLLYVVDAQYETTQGLGLFGSFNGASTQGHGNNDDDTDYGFLVQAGQLLDAQGDWEVFGRYGFVHFETGGEDLHEITGGVNRYFYGHNLKATADMVFLPNGAPAGTTGLGYVDSLGNDQYVFRIQLQLLI